MKTTNTWDVIPVSLVHSVLSIEVLPTRMKFEKCCNPKPEPRTSMLMAPVEARLARPLILAMARSYDMARVKLLSWIPAVTINAVDPKDPPLVRLVIDESLIQVVYSAPVNPVREATDTPRTSNP